MDHESSTEDSGVEREPDGEECVERMADQFRRHLLGLHQCLEHMADAANYLTHRYHVEIGSADWLRHHTTVAAFLFDGVSKMRFSTPTSVSNIYYSLIKIHMYTIISAYPSKICLYSLSNFFFQYYKKGN